MTTAFAVDDMPFERRLAETIAWCAARADVADPRGSLRTEELRPRHLVPDRASAVSDVARSRAQKMFFAKTPLKSLDARHGRLLVYFPDADLSDGAAEAASQGFFDVYNAPPWDTWIALADDGSRASASYRHYVVAWVPPGLVKLADAGIAVNPEECIAWLDRVDVRARDELLGPSRGGSVRPE